MIKAVEYLNAHIHSELHFKDVCHSHDDLRCEAHEAV